jgi:CubicO group peptidase (beta-lactamase class C family)
MVIASFVVSAALASIACRSAVPSAGDQPIAQATQDKAGWKSADLAHITSEVRSWVDEGDVVGAEFMILDHRRVVLHEAVGWMDAEDKVPMAKGSIFCVRSMTKPLVGTAVQMLIDAGKLALDDKASKFLKSFDNDRSRDITIEQMLTHRSGFPITLIDKPLKEYKDHREIVDQAGTIGPGEKPGKRFEYSDTNFETLAEIVGIVSGQSCEAFLQSRVLGPLGMKDTYCVLGKDVPDRARVCSNYVGERGHFEKYWDNQAEPLFPFLLGAAGLYSTCEDYARFVGMWLDHGSVGAEKLVSNAAIERALRPIVPLLMIGSDEPYPTSFDHVKVNYGQAWIVWDDGKPRAEGALPIFGHSGSDGTFVWVFPEKDVIALYFTQSRNGLSGFRFEELLAPLVGLETTHAAAKPERALSVDELVPLVGSFGSGELQTYAFTRIDSGRLALDLMGMATLKPAWPDKDGLWAFGAPSKASIRFTRDDKNAVTGLDVVDSGKTYHFGRVSKPPAAPSVDDLMKLRREKQGGAALDALKTLRMHAKLSTKAQQGEVFVCAAGKDHLASHTVLGKSDQTVVLADGSVWLLAPNKKREGVAGVYADQVILANPLVRMRDWRESFTEVEIIDLLDVDGEPCWVVRCATKNKPTAVRWVSVARGLTLEDNSWIAVKGLPTSSLSLRYLDYTSFGGVMMPKKIERESSAGGKMTIEYDTIEPNAELAPDAFSTEDRSHG